MKMYSETPYASHLLQNTAAAYSRHFLYITGFIRECNLCLLHPICCQPSQPPSTLQHLHHHHHVNDDAILAPLPLPHPPFHHLPPNLPLHIPSPNNRRRPSPLHRLQRLQARPQMAQQRPIPRHRLSLGQLQRH